MNKHSPAFSKMLLFYPGIKVKLFMFFPLITMFIIILFFGFIKIPDESNIYNITSHISCQDTGVYSFIYNTDSVWKLGTYYLLERNNKLISIEVVKAVKIQSDKYEISFLMQNNSDSAKGLLDRSDVKILRGKTFLGKIFSFFID